MLEIIFLDDHGEVKDLQEKKGGGGGDEGKLSRQEKR